MYSFNVIESIVYQPDIPPGPYRVSLGMYHPDTGVRLAAQIAERSVDLIVVGTLAVK